MDLLWIFLIVSAVLPAFGKTLLESRRSDRIMKLEQKHKSRVIVLIHRQEVMSILGIPLARFINIEDSERILRAIHLTPPHMPIDIILHTPGGLVLASQQIALALTRHQAKVTVFVPHYAMSGGTMLALAADEIVMDENAVLGPIDPQIGDKPAVSLLKLVESKPKDKLSDETLILADIAAKSIKQVEALLAKILSDHVPAVKVDPGNIPKIARDLVSGVWTHDHPITFEDAHKLGLPVKTGMPAEIYELMDLYPQQSSTAGSVQFIPVPYKPPVKLPPATPVPPTAKP
jgi:ClpP class serine protease